MADGNGGDGVPTIGNPEDFAGFVVVETRHLMNEQTA
jgi:hypothetical protein